MNIRLVFHFQCTIFAFSWKYTFELNDSSSSLSFAPSFSYLFIFFHRVSNSNSSHILHFKHFKHRQILFSSQVIIFFTQIFLFLFLALSFSFVFLRFCIWQQITPRRFIHLQAKVSFIIYYSSAVKDAWACMLKGKPLLLPSVFNRFKAQFSRSYEFFWSILCEQLQ